jgi:hypothetical protein
MAKRRNKPKAFLSSRKAIALPVTFLMLFVSLLILITATYYFSMLRINAKTLALKTTGVQQEMLSLEETVKFVTWSPGAYRIYEFGDFGGQFKVMPEAMPLVLNITDDLSFYDVFFNNSIGKAYYEVPPSEEIFDDVYLKGDSRGIVNQSSSTMAQLHIAQSSEHYEITLSYRPLASATVTDSDGGKPTNSLRVYVISLNASETLARLGSFRLKTSCLRVTTAARTYNFTSQITRLSIKANLDGVVGDVSLPVLSNSQGAIINLEILVCEVKLEDAGW